MMVAKRDFRRGFDSGGAQLGEELFGTRDAAEDDRRGGIRMLVRQNEFALDAPDGLSTQCRIIQLGMTPRWMAQLWIKRHVCG